MQSNPTLSLKYNQPVPRYTSYPTVPFWKEGMDITRWKACFRERFAEDHPAKGHPIEGHATNGISLYIHLPFCESLCWYCGCNKKITTNHNVEEEYIDAVLAEWGLYLAMMERRPVIREIHLGGGTPTFFSPENLERLIRGLLDPCLLHSDHSFSVEGHPANTTRAHLGTLYRLGFRRISYGVQDLNPEVQRLIHRRQSFEDLEQATRQARLAGFSSVNFDLIYGLPAQDASCLTNTIWQSLSLNPDRIAFYSYAHTPSINCGQRLIDESALPSVNEKMSLHLLGKELLTAAGYGHIGMDHYAVSGDELFKAWRKNELHRNFMGYTTQAGGILIGLGVSAISDLGTAFAQNDKTLPGYYQSIRKGELAIRKGYFLSEEDKVFGRYILDIACKGFTLFDPAWSAVLEEWTLPRLRELEIDGLVCLDGKGVVVLNAGQPFLRIICKAFDLCLLREEKIRGEGVVRCGNSTTFSTI